MEGGDLLDGGGVDDALTFGSRNILINCLTLKGSRCLWDGG